MKKKSHKISKQLNIQIQDELTERRKKFASEPAAETAS